MKLLIISGRYRVGTGIARLDLPTLWTTTANFSGGIRHERDAESAVDLAGSDSRNAGTPFGPLSYTRAATLASFDFVSCPTDDIGGRPGRRHQREHPALTTMEVRPCTEDDLALLRARWPTPDDVAGAHYAEQHATFLVGWSDTEPAGYALVQWSGCVGPHARSSFPHCVEVNHLQVRPEFRSRGIGTALLSAAEQLIREAGVAELAVSAEPAGRAIRLYERLGYRGTGIFDSCSYSWLDDTGARHHETERYELLVKDLFGR